MENNFFHENKLSWEEQCFQVVKNEHKLKPLYQSRFLIERSIKKLYLSDKTFRKQHVIKSSIGNNYNNSSFNYSIIFSNNKIPQCIYYRCKQKLDHFLKINKSCLFESDFFKVKNLLLNTNLLILHRCAFDNEVFSIFKTAKQNDIPVWYDIDDYIFNSEHYPSPFESYCGTISIDRYQSLIRSNELYSQIIDLCDGVFVSTDALRDVVNIDFPNKDCIVYPNVLDDLIDFEKNEKHENVTIFYGTPTLAHKQVFYEVLLPALIRILDKYPNVNLFLIGHFEIKENAQVFNHNNFFERKDYLNLLSKCHINLSTIEINEYTNCKSEIKWLEASQFEIPSIVPRTKTYLNIASKANEQILLFADTEEEYFQALSRLIDDECFRKKVGSEAKKFAHAERSSKIGQSILKKSLRKIVKNNKQRILIVNIWYGHNAAGGASKVVLNQVEYLHKKYSNEYDIHVLCSARSARNRNYAIENYKENGINVTKFLLPSTSWEEIEHQEVKDMCLEFYKKQDFDLIHFHCCQELTASAVEAAIDLKIPYIITVHDAWWLTKYLFLIDDTNNLVNLNQLSKEDEERYLKLKTYLEKAQRVYCVSDIFAELYRDRTGLKNIESAPNGIEKFTVVNKLPSPSGKVRVGMLGGQTYHKGYDLFLDAIKSNEYKNLEFYVIGEGKADEGINFLPRVDYKNMPHLYASLDVVVIPSRWPESYCLIAKEALYCGLWVIASNLGDTATYVEEEKNGNIINVNDSSDLKQALLKIDSNPEKIKFIKQTNVRENFEQFEQMKDIYESITINN